MKITSGKCSQHGTIRNANNTLVGKSEEKRPLGRPCHRWKDIIKMDLK
jgi:hypothetical protein